MPTLNLDSKESKESNESKDSKNLKKIILPKEIKKLLKDYEQSKWLTGC